MNPRLIVWDFNKEINVTLEDALISYESLRFMLGGKLQQPKAARPVVVHHSEEVTCKAGGIVPKPTDYVSDIEMTPTATWQHPIRLINLTKGWRTQLVVENETDAAITIAGDKPIDFKNSALIDNNASAAPSERKPTEAGDRIRIFWDEILSGAQGETETALEMTISPATFPGTYRVVGDTLIRSEKTGKDERFQFVINKAESTLAA